MWIGFIRYENLYALKKVEKKFQFKMKLIEISKYPIEVLDCPDNVESIEITIEEVINQYDDHNFLKTVKRKIDIRSPTQLSFRFITHSLTRSHLVHSLTFALTRKWARSTVRSLSR